MLTSSCQKELPDDIKNVTESKGDQSGQSDTPTPTPTPKKNPDDSRIGNSNPNDGNGAGKDTGVPKATATPTPTAKPTASPTPSPKPTSSVQNPNNSMNDGSVKKHDDEVKKNEPEPTTPVNPIDTYVPDCDNPGEMKLQPGNVDSNADTLNTPTEKTDGVDYDGNPYKDNTDETKRDNGWKGLGL